MPSVQPDPIDLAGRVVMVTGAGAGIGRAVAEAAAEAGATTLLLGRTVAHLEETYDRIVAASGPQPAIVPLDLGTTEETPFRRVAAAIDEQFGRLDALVHCAGLLGPKSPNEHYPMAAWREVMRVNVDGAVALTQALLPALRSADNASVVFTSSSVGRAGRAYWGAYAASKFAIEGVVQVLADELENTTRIRVNSVNPRATRTAMRAAAYPGEDPQSVPLPERRTPIYLHLISAASIGVTGRQFDADDLPLDD